MDSSHGIFTYIQLTSAQNMEVSITKYFFYWKTIPTYAYTNTIDSDFHICTFFSYTHFLQGDYNMEYQVLVHIFLSNPGRKFGNYGAKTQITKPIYDM